MSPFCGAVFSPGVIPAYVNQVEACSGQETVRVNIESIFALENDFFEFVLQEANVDEFWAHRPQNINSYHSGTSLAQTASFQPSCIVIGCVVWALDFNSATTTKVWHVIVVLVISLDKGVPYVETKDSDRTVMAEQGRCRGCFELPTSLRQRLTELKIMSSDCVPGAADTHLGVHRYVAD